MDRFEYGFRCLVLRLRPVGLDNAIDVIVDAVEFIGEENPLRYYSIWLRPVNNVLGYEIDRYIFDYGG